MVFEDDLERLHKSATRGPWGAEGVGGIHMDGTRDGYTILSAEERRIASIHMVTTGRMARRHDAELIPRLRNATPEIIALIRAARAVTRAIEAHHPKFAQGPFTLTRDEVEALFEALEALDTKEGSRNA